VDAPFLCERVDGGLFKIGDGAHTQQCPGKAWYSWDQDTTTSQRRLQPLPDVDHVNVYEEKSQ
jgi:hypothetical protein